MIQIQFVLVSRLSQNKKKQHFYVKGKKINTSNHVFSLNITNKTDKIVMVFRKKNPLGDDPIIASATIHLKKFTELPIEQITSGTQMTDVRILDLFYPLQKQIEEEQTKCAANKQMRRKVVGQMEVQLSFSSPYLNSNKEKTNKKENNKEDKNISKKINKCCKPKKNRKYEQITEEKCYMNFNLL
ncbi:hypothetical protein M9Y10_003190 [Tritrichomonas musculus]|uniref:MSP domain-containing protein n=1 Tax=Tritrichomonas musculus TaxID=1915356 RepID=A0ABR2JP85_9EUKA